MCFLHVYSDALKALKTMCIFGRSVGHTNESRQSTKQSLPKPRLTSDGHERLLGSLKQFRSTCMTTLIGRLLSDNASQAKLNLYEELCVRDSRRKFRSLEASCAPSATGVPSWKWLGEAGPPGGRFLNVHTLQQAFIDDHVYVGKWRLGHKESWGVIIKIINFSLLLFFSYPSIPTYSGSHCLSYSRLHHRQDREAT